MATVRALFSTFFLAVGIVPANFCSARWWASFQRAVLQLDFSPFLSVFCFSLAVLSVVLLSCIILFALAWHLYSLHCSQLIDSSVVSAEGHYLNTTKNESVGQVKMKRVALRSLGPGDSFSLLLPFSDLFF